MGSDLFDILVFLIYLAILIISIIALVKFFQMAENVQALRDHFTPKGKSPIIKKSELTILSAQEAAKSGDIPRAIKIAQQIMEQNPGYSPEHRNAERFIEGLNNSK